MTLPVSTSSITVGLDGSSEVATFQCGGRFESSISSGKYVTIIGNVENPSKKASEKNNYII